MRISFALLLVVCVTRTTHAGVIEVASRWFDAVTSHDVKALVNRSALPFVTEGIAKACERATATDRKELRAIARCLATDHFFSEMGGASWKIVDLPQVPKTRQRAVASLQNVQLVFTDLEGDGIRYGLVLAIRNGRVVAAVAEWNVFE